MLCPPPLTFNSSTWSRANPTATSRAETGCTTSAGGLAAKAFHTSTAPSQPSSAGRSRRPSIREVNSSSDSGLRRTWPPSRPGDVDCGRSHDATGSGVESVVGVPIATRKAARKAAGCSRGGSSPASSIICSGQP